MPFCKKIGLEPRWKYSENSHFQDFKTLGSKLLVAKSNKKSTFWLLLMWAWLFMRDILVQVWDNRTLHSSAYCSHRWHLSSGAGQYAWIMYRTKLSTSLRKREINITCFRTPSLSFNVAATNLWNLSPRPKVLNTAGYQKYQEFQSAAKSGNFSPTIVGQSPKIA